MADQCIVCLENLDSAIPLQQLPLQQQQQQQQQGEDGSSDLKPFSLAAAASASPTASSTTTNETTTTTTTTATTVKDLIANGDSNLENDDNIAVIQVCGHILHDSCLKAWSGKANSCPICRQAFHLVEVYDKIGGEFLSSPLSRLRELYNHRRHQQTLTLAISELGTLLNTYKVEDKKQVAEFDPLAWLDENPEEEEEVTPCPVCNTTDHEDVLLLCDGCDTPYHTHCIGLEDVPDGAWFCMECADQNGTALQQFHALTSRTSASVRSRGHGAAGGGRRNRFFPRTQAAMRNERTRARTDQWLGAWGQVSGQIYGALGIDLDSNDDEDADMREYRRSQQVRERDRRERSRWLQRLTIASRLGARDVFARNIQGVVGHQAAPPSQQTAPAVPETPEERQAWRAFERARAATPTSRKRKSRSITASPVEPVPEPSRPLKRPRTRRIPNLAEPGPSRAASTTANHPQDERNGDSFNGRSPIAMEDQPSFLSSLLKEVEQSGPSDDEAIRSVFGLPQAVDPSSPVTSPSASTHNSPRAMSLTPPPPPPPPSTNATARSASRSPVLSLSSHIEPRYPPANYSPTRSNGESSDSESRSRRQRNGSPELRQPRPTRQVEVRLSRSQDSSPTRKKLPLEVKEDINQVVRAALKPHWKSSHAQLSRDQYEAINRKVSHKIYEEVTDPWAVNDEAKQQWEKVATTEVARAVAELRS